MRYYTYWAHLVSWIWVSGWAVVTDALTAPCTKVKILMDYDSFVVHHYTVYDSSCLRELLHSKLTKKRKFVLTSKLTVSLSLTCHGTYGGFMVRLGLCCHTFKSNEPSIFRHTLLTFLIFPRNLLMPPNVRALLTNTIVCIWITHVESLECVFYKPRFLHGCKQKPAVSASCNNETGGELKGRQPYWE